MSPARSMACVAGEMGWAVRLTLAGQAAGDDGDHICHQRRQPGQPVLGQYAETPGAAVAGADQPLCRTQPGPDGKEAKDEHWFRVADGEVAGLWRRTAVGDAHAFLTCAPYPPVEPLHPKARPANLAEEDYATWRGGEADAAGMLTMPFPSQLMVVG